MKGTITIEVLKSVDSLHVKPEERELPSKFFKNRDGLYVSTSAQERIVSKAEPVEANKDYQLETFDLVRASSDEDIEASLEHQNVFSETDVAAILTSLIAVQAKGEGGPLNTKGDWNLFYTPSCVVRVCWFGGEWDVSAWERGGSDWLAGGRVFSPRI